MKYTFLGFSQGAALKIQKVSKNNGKTKVLKLDTIDLILLRWLVDFYPSMKKKTINGKDYVWVNYASILDDLPLMPIKKRSVFGRFQKMCELGVLIHHFDKNGGSFSYYGFGENYLGLVSDKGMSKTAGGLQKTTQGSAKNDIGGLQKTTQGVCKKRHTKDKSTNNKSTNNKSINTSVEKYKKEKSNHYPENENIIPDNTNDYINKHSEDIIIADKVLAVFNIRLKRKKSVDIAAAMHFLQRLEKVSGGNYDKKIERLDDAIAGDYYTVYAPLTRSYTYSANNSDNILLDEINWGLQGMDMDNRVSQYGEEKLAHDV